MQLGITIWKEMKMAIAVFMESYDSSMGLHRRQTMVVPHNGDVLVYTRVTDGQKGPHNKWLGADFDAVVNDMQTTGEQLTAEPVGIAVTMADTRAISDKGYSPVLGTKAVMAHDKSGPASEADAVTRFCEIYEMVSNDDLSLEDLIIDMRRVTNEVQPPVIKTHPASPVAVVVTDDTPEPEPVLVIEDVPVMAASEPNNAGAKHIVANLASVPPAHLDKRYVHRKIHGVDDYAVYDFARANHINVLIYGPTGPGKTTSIEAWCAARGLRLAQVSGNAALEPGHLFGKFVPDGEGGLAWVDGPVTDVVRNGGVLNLDELNFISPKIYTTLYSLLTSQRMITLLDHHGEVINAHQDLTIFATMNPDYVGTTPLNFAMRNRFDIQIAWDYDDDVESKLVKAKNLLVLARQLRDEAAKGLYETPISTNMLIEFDDLVSGLGYEFAVENFIAHFAGDEQASVRLVFQTHEFNIKQDFGIEMSITTDTEAAAPNIEVVLEDASNANISATSTNTGAIPGVTVTI